jgi:glycosyl transferase, family 25
MDTSGREFRDFLPYRVCINLDRRAERWKRMEARFSALNFWPVERFPAIEGASAQIPASWPESHGAYGCLQSHLRIVQKARDEGRESVLIMEDDILFDDQFHEKFSERVSGLPQKWDMLFFGCLHSDPPTPVANGIAKVRGSFSTFMYAIRQPVYDAFIRLNSRAKQAVDRNNTILQRLFNCYCFVPHLAWVDDSYSDAQQTHTNHWYIRQSMVLRGKDAKAMEARTAVILLYRVSGDCERGLRNVRYLANHYGRLFTVLVMECDAEPHLKRDALPSHCDYCFLECRAGVNPMRCFAEGIKRYEQRKDYFIFNDGNVVCSRMEMSANILKCADYDVVSSFRSYIDLNESDSNRLIDGLTCQTESYDSRARRSMLSEYFTVRRSAFRAIEHKLTRGDPSQEAQALRDVRVFDSPGCALCLYSD